MNQQLSGLIDKEAIRDLRILYSHYLDSNNLDLLDQVFTADAVVEVTVGTLRGLTEIRAGLAGAFTLYDRDGQGTYPFLHTVTNHWIKLTGPDTAEGLCYLLDFETASKPDPNPLLLLGLYADEYKRVDGAWRISRTRLDVAWPNRSAGTPPRPVFDVPGRA
ncbi:MAG: nuclear transport factor 2 family protein [Azospirillaceae bacterium]|nr:nuclear transport factor 2 family protein [Azospirillaceae bacterium]